MGNKRYIIYFWDQKDQQYYQSELGIELTEALKQGNRDVMDFGIKLSSFDTEEEAINYTNKINNCTSHDIFSIYDAEEHTWSN